MRFPLPLTRSLLLSGTIGLFLLAGNGSIHAATRIGVVDVDRKPDFEVPLVAALSTDPALEILERAKLQNLVDERQLSDLTAAGELRRLGSLIGAEGLLVIETLPTTQSSPRRTLRLISATDGSCRFVAVIPNIKPGSAEFKNWATWVGQAIHSKLVDLKDPTRAATPVSLLNIRATTDSPKNREIERAISRLLEQTLSEDSDLQVLERRALRQVGFERSLDASDATPLKTGAVLIDGAFQPNASGDGMVIKIRLRTEGGAKSQQLELQTESDPVKVAAEIHRSLRHALGAGLLESPIHLEAAEFLAEAKWAFRNELTDECLEALAAAEALGYCKPELYSLRGQAVCKALDQDLGGYSSEETELRSIEARVSWIQTAFDSLAAFQSSSGKAQAPFTYELLKQAGCFLEERDKAGDDAYEWLRPKLRQLSGMNLEDANQMPGLISAGRHASTWAKDGPQLIAFYRLILSSDHKWLTTFFRYLPKSRNSMLGARFQKDPPTVIAWEQLIQELLGNPKTRARSQFLLGVKDANDSQKESYPKFLQELILQANVLQASGDLQIFLENDDTDLPEFNKNRAELFIYLLENLSNYERGLIPFALRLKVPAELQLQLAGALDRYQERMNEAVISAEDRKIQARDISTLIRIVRQNHPKIEVNENSRPLIVSSFWHPFDWAPPEAKSFLYGSLIVHENDIWISSSYLKDTLLQITLPDFQVKTHPLGGQNLIFAGDELLIRQPKTEGSNPSLVRYNPKTGVKESTPLPQSGQIMTAGNRIFCFAPTAATMWEIEFGRDPQLIFSARRRPKETPLDDRNPDPSIRLFAGKEGIPYIMASEDKSIRDLDNQWQVIQKISFPQANPTGTETIISSHDDGVFLYGPQYPAPLRLLNGRKTPDAATHFNWVDPGQFINGGQKFAWREGELFRMETTAEGKFQIRWWLKDGPAAGWLIPLQLQLSPQTEATAEKASHNFLEYYTIDRMRQPTGLQILGTPFGLVLAPGAFGFWFIPNADLQKWREEHPSPSSPGK